MSNSQLQVAEQLRNDGIGGSVVSCEIYLHDEDQLEHQFLEAQVSS